MLDPVFCRDRVGFTHFFWESFLMLHPQHMPLYSPIVATMQKENRIPRCIHYFVVAGPKHHFFFLYSYKKKKKNLFWVKGTRHKFLKHSVSIASGFAKRQWVNCRMKIRIRCQWAFFVLLRRQSHENVLAHCHSCGPHWSDGGRVSFWPPYATFSVCTKGFPGTDAEYVPQSIVSRALWSAECQHKGMFTRRAFSDQTACGRP